MKDSQPIKTVQFQIASTFGTDWIEGFLYATPLFSMKASGRFFGEPT